MKLFKDLFNAKYILESKRYAWIDYIRGICIILVCYRHCFDGLKGAGEPMGDFPVLQLLNTFFYSFRMPLFFIVSGLFVSYSLRKKSLGEYINSRFRIVFYPLMIWGSIQITLQIIFKKYVNGNPAFSDYIDLIIFPRNPGNNQQFWYLNALFFVGVFYAVFKEVFHFKLKQQVILSFAFYALAAYLNYRDINFYIFPDIFHYYIYFCVGDIISSIIFKKETTDKILSPKWMVTSAIVFFTLQSIFTLISMKHETDNYIYNKMMYLLLPIALSGCFFMIQIGKLLEKKNILKWLRVVGYHSLYIYLMHIMLIAGVRLIMIHIFHVNYVPVMMLVAIATGVVVPIIAYNLCIRLHGWWLFSLKKPEAEINYYSAVKPV